jgi:hypothetical protein
LMGVYPLLYVPDKPFLRENLTTIIRIRDAHTKPL